MGLNQHEFDVAPELLAALVLGVVDTGDRAEIDGVIGDIEAFLDMHAHDESSAHRVGGTLGGAGPEVSNDQASRHGGITRRVGLFDNKSQRSQSSVGSRRPWGTFGSMPDRHVSRRDPYGLAERQGRAGLTPAGDSYPNTPPTESERRRIQIKEALNALFVDDLTCDRNCNYQRRTEAIRELQRLLNRSGNRTPKDDEAGASTPNTAVDWWSLSAYLKSLGGLGIAQQPDEHGQATRPRIFDAVDPSPDSDDSDALANTISYWMLNLVDPTPEI